jgi:hypothetical protein
LIFESIQKIKANLRDKSEKKPKEYSLFDFKKSGRKLFGKKTNIAKDYCQSKTPVFPDKEPKKSRLENLTVIYRLDPENGLVKNDMPPITTVNIRPRTRGKKQEFKEKEKKCKDHRTRYEPARIFYNSILGHKISYPRNIEYIN